MPVKITVVPWQIGFSLAEMEIAGVTEEFTVIAIAGVLCADSHPFSVQVAV